MLKKDLFHDSTAIALDEWLDRKLHFYHVRTLNKSVIKYPEWKQAIQIPYERQCYLMFENLRAKLNKKYHIRLNHLELKTKQAVKILCYQPSTLKSKLFKKKYRDIFSEGNILFRNKPNLWNDYIRPVLVDLANFIIAGLQFVLSALKPSLKNYKGAFFAKPHQQTYEEICLIWKQEMEASQTIFHEIADHAVNLRILPIGK